MTLAVVTVCHSYFDFLPGWARSVAALDTEPDEIVIVTSDIERAVTAAGDVLPRLTVVRRDGPMQFGEWFNDAVSACSSEWVAWIGCDDRYRPHALDGIERDDADVVAFGMAYDAGTWMPSPSAASILTLSGNEVPCGSPFRRSLWERSPFTPHLTPYEDWALWAGFARDGARFTATGRIDFDYRHHAGTPTEAEPTRTRIRQWLESS